MISCIWHQRYRQQKKKQIINIKKLHASKDSMHRVKEQPTKRGVGVGVDSQIKNSIGINTQNTQRTKTQWQKHKHNSKTSKGSDWILLQRR